MTVNRPNKIIVHCSATPDNDKFEIDANEIRHWHIARGWNDIGYHYVINRDGIIEMGRLETTVGAHVKGHNTNSLGICFIGNNQFTDAQYNAFHSLYMDIYIRHAIEVENVYGHYEFTDKKTCPNIDMEHFRNSLKRFTT